MARPLSNLLILLVITLAGSTAFAQTTVPDPLDPAPNPTREPLPRTVREQIANRQISRQRKEHEAMLQRGQEALELVEKLTTATEDKTVLSAQDKKNLADLEKLVARIRRDLGGSDDKQPLNFPVHQGDEPEDVPDSNSLSDAIRFMKKKTVTLVDELSRSSRFSVSAVAIQSSNTIIRLTRYLRLR